jgi:hypothetical protein
MLSCTIESCLLKNENSRILCETALLFDFLEHKSRRTFQFMHPLLVLRRNLFLFNSWIRSELRRQLILLLASILFLYLLSKPHLVFLTGTCCLTTRLSSRGCCSCSVSEGNFFVPAVYFGFLKVRMLYAWLSPWDWSALNFIVERGGTTGTANLKKGSSISIEQN